jgi:hypothetical protein
VAGWSPYDVDSMCALDLGNVEQEYMGGLSYLPCLNCCGNDERQLLTHSFDYNDLLDEVNGPATETLDHDVTNKISIRQYQDIPK